MKASNVQYHGWSIEVPVHMPQAEARVRFLSFAATWSSSALIADSLVDSRSTSMCYPDVFKIFFDGTTSFAEKVVLLVRSSQHPEGLPAIFKEGADPVAATRVSDRDAVADFRARLDHGCFPRRRGIG